MIKTICLVLNNFKNDSRVLKTSLSLSANKYEVSIIALHDNGQLVSEKVQGIQVDRIKLISRSWSKHKIVQLIKLIEWTLVATWRARAADIIHCNDLNTLHVGIALKLLSIGRIKVVYDAHEYETEINGISGAEKILMSWFERGLIKFADKVITVSNGIAEEYARLYNIEKPALVLNCPPYRAVCKNNLFREKLGIAAEQTVFLYQGGLSKGRGIELLLETFASLDADSVIVFMGYGPLEGLIKDLASAHKNIYFHPAVAPDVLLAYTSSADFGISTIENKCLSYYYCLPNKLFEYLMVGLPVIVSNLHEMKKLVEQNGIGVVAEENTVQGLQQAIRHAEKLDKTVVRENIDKIKRIYCWEEQERILLKDVYRDL